MFNFINTKKEKKWLDIDYLKKLNIDGRGGLKIIDIDLYVKEAESKIKEMDIKKILELHQK